MKILIVEDEILLADTLKTALKKKAFPLRRPMTEKPAKNLPSLASMIF